MAVDQMSGPWRLVFPAGAFRILRDHLFPGDHDEHGAVLACGTVASDRGTRLLVRDVFLARDGIDYVPGERGYRMVTADFVRDHALYCRDEKLAYLAVHCHRGDDSVWFSPDDIASHERGYPALLDILEDQIVGGIVFAPNAVAGDLWLPGRGWIRRELSETVVVGRPVRTLYPRPSQPTSISDRTYDRQSRIFGDRGQEVLARQKVGVIGAGGAGSLLIEYLARLGVGHIVVVDPDRIDVTNLSRVVDATRRDALSWFASGPTWVRRIAARWARLKVAIATRVARRANPKIRIEAVADDFTRDHVARLVTDCDFVFLAADPMQVRLVFNALVHQYLIPGAQVGAKVRVDRETGSVVDAYSVYRPVTPDCGCLWCNGLVPPSLLQEEAMNERERAAQRYVEDELIVAPSVITLNAVAVSHAVDDYLFTITGLLSEAATGDYVRFLPQMRDVMFDEPRKDEACPECSHAPGSRFARGNGRDLPTR